VGALAAQLRCNSYDRLELFLCIDVGETLAEVAVRRPRDLFVGVEIRTEKCEIAHSRLRALRLPNVAVVCMEAEDFLSRAGPSGAVDGIHVYFPTPSPWNLGVDHPNLRRRLFNPHFVAECHRVLRVMGQVCLITDRADYFTESASRFAASLWLQQDWRAPEGVDTRGMLIGTPTERGLREAGATQFYSLCMAKA
jgi:tRNA G46 methylase TrmB